VGSEVCIKDSDGGWDYPPSFNDMLGRSLLMEAIFMGPLEQVIQRVARQRDPGGIRAAGRLREGTGGS